MKYLFKPLLGVLIILFAASCKKTTEESGTTAEASVPSDSTADVGFIKIFDGKTLSGWDGDTTYWHVKDGSLVGEVTPTTPLKTNTFIMWTGGQPADFELKVEFRITESANSGIQYRSEKFEGEPYSLKGYQADIDGKNSYTGQNYDERGRTTLAYRGEIVVIHAEDKATAVIRSGAWSNREVTGSLGKSDSLKSLVKSQDWNTCRIVAKGNHLQHYINGVLMSDVTDEDEANRKSSGIIGFQAHVGPPMKVEYRNIMLKKL